MDFYFRENGYQFLIIAIVSYLVGCFNFAKLISVIKKKDITKIGSGNPGTMNMSREFGLKIGLLTFVCDAIKGGLPALIVHILYKGYVFAGTAVEVCDFARYFAGTFVIVGHIFPVTMKFKGGKGIASTLGLFWVGLSCESSWFALIVLGLLLGVVLFIFLTEWGSLGSLLGVSGLSVVQLSVFFFRYADMVNVYLVCLYLIILSINVLTWCAHHKNIARLFAGEEHHTSIKKLAKKKAGKKL